jgi:predicted transcriptional regulator
VPERELAAELGITRTSLKNALARARKARDEAEAAREHLRSRGPGTPFGGP